jgi:Na+/melibiose symporter-like transporter
MKVWIPIAAFAITIVALFFYPLTKEKEQKMGQELAEKREIAV